MEVPTVSSLLSLFVLFACAAYPTATAAADPVLDINGQRLRTGVNYYILPVIRGRGGGVTMGRAGNTTCPLSVIQEWSEVSTGLPLTFSPVNKSRDVLVSTDLNIKFSASSICVQSTVWTLHFDEATKKRFVTTGGVEANPGRQTISNWFKIEKLKDDYKLVFCPTVCNFCKPICGDIGVYVQDGKRRLALSDVPFMVMFKRA